SPYPQSPYPPQGAAYGQGYAQGAAPYTQAPAPYTESPAPYGGEAPAAQPEPVCGCETRVVPEYRDVIVPVMSTREVPVFMERCVPVYEEVRVPVMGETC